MALWALSLSLCSSAVVRASAGRPPTTESEVKAAYLYNFAKFIAWPDPSFAGPSAPIKICLLSDPSFEITLKEIIDARAIDSHPVQVLRVVTAAEARTCHLLFVSSDQDKQGRAVMEGLGACCVVTVGETQSFLERGGIIRFSVQQGRVQFQVNLHAATQAGVRISARLLSVATRVLQ